MPSARWDGRSAFALCAIAFVWAAGIFVFALPLVSDGRGQTAVAPPAVAALAVGLLLHRYCATGSRAGVTLALAVVVLLFAFVAILSIGIFVLPMAAALATAVGLTPPGARIPPAPRCRV